MDADWSTSPSARRVLQHAEDSRPAWLWSADGQELLWHNGAAPLLNAKLKKHGLKLMAPAVPIKGQVARNIRLGSVGRTSLARIQFLAGEKPVSSTCATTPLTWEDGQTALLIVGVDPIADEIIQAAKSQQDTPAVETRQPELLATDSEPAATVAEHLVQSAHDQPEVRDEHQTEPEQPIAHQEAAGAQDEPEHAKAEQPSGGSSDAEPLIEQELANWQESEQEEATSPEKAVPDLLATNLEERSAAPDHEQEVAPPPAPSRLSLLVDRLAADEALFTPLTAADDAPPPSLAMEIVEPDDRSEAPQDELEAPDLPPAPTSPAHVDQVPAPDSDLEQAPAAEIIPPPAPPADPEAVERVSRYNFDELARILTDRVGEPAAPVPAETPRSGGALINLGGETLVLNRLPLGILVFRDQQVLFANRAITEMVGYPSVESLRSAGLAAVFPSAGPDGGDDAGPVNHLVQRDGTLVPVTARLQSISWQGKPALMLSASATEVRTSHEGAVAAFARSFADLRGDGYFEATRQGVISAGSQRGVELLGGKGMLEGKALSSLVSASDLSALREFLERPARFAETARPCLSLRAAAGQSEIALFAQGQAGVVTGYFGFVRARDMAPARLPAGTEADPALLARISRGVRRPLNTIIGFADMIRSEAFGAGSQERFETYAQDITTAGQEIAALVDELDDYARLRDGRYLPQRASIDLTSLLESCVLRIRQQASGARVIVRNAISETLPRVTADRASLAQAVLNLLASAIDQTPTGGGVVISAHREDDGSIAVHVRDSSNNAVDMAERFVVFRDGPGRDGQMMVPVRSSIGLALTRSLLAVNAFSLSVDPAGEQGMLFTMIIPAELVESSSSDGRSE
ncbi:MAG TPA: histidine kinase dimerization/phospho-acceptor domain-containing protein [Devosia sp.]|jgi:signal transduction histidine kinase|uniref:sensor histidine kinase n=1 Tax=Devosia sp. TaxID=1871048 RepID=UPI002F9407BC